MPLLLISPVKPLTLSKKYKRNKEYTFLDSLDNNLENKGRITRSYSKELLPYKVYITILYPGSYRFYKAYILKIIRDPTYLYLISPTYNKCNYYTYLYKSYKFISYLPIIIILLVSY